MKYWPRITGQCDSTFLIILQVTKQDATKEHWLITILNVNNLCNTNADTIQRNAFVREI